MTEGRLRAAVIGCGWMGSTVADDPLADGIQAHAAAYAACPETLLAAVCDRDAARVSQAARRWGTPRGFTDLAALLAEVRPQAISICTPDATHAAVLGQVLSSPEVRVVVAEKPLAASLAEARPLVELARRRGVTLAVNYTRRYSAAHVEAQRRIATGEIGTVVAVSGMYTKGVVHNGTHWFDLARWLVGEVAQVQAWRGASDQPPDDPTCHVRLGFAGGQTGFLFGLDAEQFTVFEMDVVGTRGRLRITDSGRRLSWSQVAASAHFSGYRSLAPAPESAGGFHDATLALIADAVAAQRAQTAPRCSGTDALAALAVADAARRSVAAGGTACAVEALA